MEFRRFPMREGQRNCSFYIQTGQCKYGASCLFNHPANRALAIASSMKVEYPEKKGRPECQYFIKTGFCKYGASCKFNHSGITGRVALNVLGYPLRPYVIECAYYMRTGKCKYGAACIYHHPQPIRDDSLGLPGSSGYHPAMHFPTTVDLSYPLARRASYIPGTQWPQIFGDYVPLDMPRDVTAAPEWNPYNVSVVSSTGIVPQASSILTNDPLNAEAISIGRAHYRSGFLPPICYGFPERPGKPECQYYLKTGECKYGTVCKYHHPKERCLHFPNCVLSPKGLPLRPGEHLCFFYSRYGSCKFGASCKYDHPVEASGSSFATEITVVVSSSSTESVASNLFQDGLVEEDSTTKDMKKICLFEETQKPNGGDAIGSWFRVIEHLLDDE